MNTTKMAFSLLALCSLIAGAVAATATVDRDKAFVNTAAQGNDFEAYYIAAGRGWSNPLSKSYNPVEDKEAWKVAVPFLIRIASTPGKKEKPPSVIDKAKDKIQSLFQ